METEDDIRKRLQRYHALLLYVTDEQAVTAIRRLIQEAEARLLELCAIRTVDNDRPS